MESSVAARATALPLPMGRFMIDLSCLAIFMIGKIIEGYS